MHVQLRLSIKVKDFIISSNESYVIPKEFTSTFLGITNDSSFVSRGRNSSTKKKKKKKELELYQRTSEQISILIIYYRILLYTSFLI